MTIDFKRKIVFTILELTSSITIGLFALSISEKLWNFTDSIMILFLFVYSSSILGIIIPGYFFLKLNGNKEIYIGAIASSIIWMFIAIFIYIILAFFIGIIFLGTKEAGLIFPLIFGVIGFNHFAFNIKITRTHNRNF
ncbi:MAG: hypothetical protein V4670_10390 [Bacteroidota bacterium]